MRRPFDIYDGCEKCPFVENCIDEAGYTCSDEYGYCPGEFILEANKDNII